MPEVVVERSDPDNPLPTYAREGDSGFDLSAGCYYGFGPWETHVVSTGIFMHIPEGYEIQIRPRSSLSKEGILVHFGTVDEGYRGEIKVIMTNLTPSLQKVYGGDRIAQAVLAPVTRATIVEGTVSVDTERGKQGFGSTGR